MDHSAEFAGRPTKVRQAPSYCTSFSLANSSCAVVVDLATRVPLPTLDRGRPSPRSACTPTNPSTHLSQGTFMSPIKSRKGSRPTVLFAAHSQFVDDVSARPPGAGPHVMRPMRLTLRPRPKRRSRRRRDLAGVQVNSYAGPVTGSTGSPPRNSPNRYSIRRRR